MRAHSWLNWVDEDDDEHDEVGLKDYIEIRTEAPGVWNKGLN